MDYGQVVKQYGGSPSRYQGSVKTVISGEPRAENISTCFIERENLTTRMSVRRFMRRTNAFSKKLRNHAAAFALYAAHYNFCRVHETLRTTPAVAIGLADHVWSIGELIDAALSIAPERELVAVSVVAEVVPQIAARGLAPDSILAEAVPEIAAPGPVAQMAAPELVPEIVLAVVAEVAAPELVPEIAQAEVMVPEVAPPEPAIEEARREPLYLPRTIKEKWQAVADLLKQAETRALSNAQIGRRLQVTHSFVGTVRRRLEADGVIPPVPIRLGADRKRHSLPGQACGRSGS